MKRTGQLLKDKEKIFNQLKLAVNQFENYEISLSTLLIFLFFNYKIPKLGELEAVYKEYQEIQVAEQTVNPPTTRRIPSPLQKENLTTTRPSHQETRKTHQRWKSVFNHGDESLDLEHSVCNTSRAFEENEILKPSLQNLDNIPRQSYVQDKHNYSYTNLISILDMKVKAESLIPTSIPVQRQITRSSDSRAKLQNMFRDHSRFLSDIKDQVISFLISSLLI